LQLTISGIKVVII